jgi:methionyl-tRNA formyltransferase
MKIKKCLFLGYNQKQTSIIKFLKKNNFIVNNFKNIPKLIYFKQSDLIVSFGFRKLINKKILSTITCPIVNIHLSYLPYNRGAHPNFWSFIEKTFSGVTIHEIDSGIDTGRIILRKKIKFNINNIKSNTFKKTYNFLFKKAEELFKRNFEYIVSGKYNYILRRGNGTFHNKKDLPKFIKKWNINIKKTIAKYKKNNLS